MRGHVAKVKCQSCCMAPGFRVDLLPKSKWPKWQKFEIWVQSKNKFIIFVNYIYLSTSVSWIKCRSLNICKLSIWIRCEKFLAEFIRGFDLAAVIHFFDMFFQYQSCGIDPDIWVDMWPKFFVQLWHVAWEFRDNSTKMTVLFFKYSGPAPIGQ